MKSIMNWLTNAKEVNEEREQGEELLERAKHLLGKHNQTAHGYRLSKTPSLETARRYRKEGILEDFMGRARARQGTKPAKDRNAERPKKPKLKDPKDVAKRATDPATVWETRRQYSTGSAQQQVLDRLGIRANNAGHAENIFRELGIVVSPKREGKRSVPVVSLVESGGGRNVYGEGEGSYTPSTGIDLSAIVDLIQK